MTARHGHPTAEPTVPVEALRLAIKGPATRTSAQPVQQGGAVAVVDDYCEYLPNGSRQP